MKNRGVINLTLSDLRGRVDTLAKSIFLISGGSVTLSINLYMSHKDNFSQVVVFLKHSWWAFLISILLFVVVIGLLILQGFISSEYYRKKIEKGKGITNHPKRRLDYFAMGVGVIGFSFFVYGMAMLIKAASML